MPKGCRLPAVFSPSELTNQENLFATKAFGKQEILFTNPECNISAEISKGKDASENGRKMEALLKLVKNLLQQRVGRAALVILNLNPLQTEHHESLPKELLERNLQFGFS